MPKAAQGRKLGRPRKKGKLVPLPSRVSPRVRQALVDQAAKIGVSVSYYLRHVLRCVVDGKVRIPDVKAKSE